MSKSLVKIRRGKKVEEKKFVALEKVIKRGTKVRIKSCEASRHGKQVKACVCRFVGRIVEIGHLFQTENMNAAHAYHIKVDEEYKLVSRAEFVILRDQTVEVD